MIETDREKVETNQSRSAWATVGGSVGMVAGLGVGIEVCDAIECEPTNADKLGNSLSQDTVVVGSLAIGGALLGGVLALGIRRFFSHD